MTNLRNCETCYAFRICPQKPKRENYTDENKYLIDLECGVWNCKSTVENLWKQLTQAKELLIGFVSKMESSVYTPYEKDLVERAKQFLKESE